MASLSAPTTPAARPWASLSALSLLLLATALIYWPVFGFDFIKYDDPRYVVENPLVQQGLTVAGLVSAFSSFQVGYWIPVTLVSFMLDAELWGMHAGGFHLTNLLLHLVNVTLFFLFLRQMTGRRWTSILATALFALHPLHVQSVAWVTERKDVLSTLFWLAALLAYLAYLRHRSLPRYLLLAVLFALGLMAKPMLVTLPLVLLLLDFWPLGRAGRPLQGKERGAIRRWSPLVLEKAPLFAMAAVIGLLTAIAQQADGAVVPIGALSPATRIINAVVTPAAYLAKAVWPRGLNVLYLYPTGGWGPGRIAASLIALAAFTALAIRLRRSHGYLLTGWLWYLGTLLPVSGLFQSGAQVMADRFAYVPLQGLYFALALGLADLAGQRRGRRLSLAAAAATVLCILALIAQFQVGTWRDSETLFRRAVRVEPRNWIARLSFGMALLDRGEREAAMAEFSQTLRSAPAPAIPELRGEIGLALGIALIREGRFGEAEGPLIAALARAPDSVPALDYLGRALAGLGRWEEALQAGRKAVLLDPENAALHNRLGTSLSALGRRAEALEHFRVALRSDPDMDDARYNIGLSLVEQGLLAEAVPVLEEHCRRLPLDGAAHYQLGVALRGTGNSEAANRHFAEAARLNAATRSVRP